MPFLSGVFSRIHNWQNDRDANIDILADRHDEEDDNFATALNLTLLRDGTSTVTQNIPMNGKRFTGLGASVDPNDSVRRQELTDAISPGYSNIGDYLTTLRAPGASWLKRDGATYLQANYPALFALIGQSYGRPSGLPSTCAICLMSRQNIGQPFGRSIIVP